MKVYNGEKAILGRLAAVVAKDILLGEEVKIINCEKIVISGRKTNTFAREYQKRERRGYPLKSAKTPKTPERFVRRTVRGMIPWRRERGKTAYKRVKCYIGVPDEFAKEKLSSLPKTAMLEKLPTLKYTTVEAVCKNLGGNI
jgi:large subunit ribosomal protein L13